MALVANHSTVVVVADDGTSPVGSDEWNADHPVTGTVGPDVGARELLTANRTYYVATTGNDANNGLTVGTPFLTIQKAVDTALQTLDAGPYTVTIQLADGTYSEEVVIGGPLLRGTSEWDNQFIIKGNTANPENVILDKDDGICISTNAGGAVYLQDFTLQGNAATTCLGSYSYGIINGNNLRFGVAQWHMQPAVGGTISLNGYEIFDDAAAHMYPVSLGFAEVVPGSTVTLTGTPSFSVAFVFAEQVGVAHLEGVTFTGSATGLRYALGQNSQLFQGPGTAHDYLPGSVTGMCLSGSTVEPLSEQAQVLTLANGANSNLVVIGGQNYARITGPSAAFSVTGFVNNQLALGSPNDGLTLTLQNPTAHALTIVNDATSTAANRILTNTSADVVLPGPCVADFIYSYSDSRWIYKRPAGREILSANRTYYVRTAADGTPGSDSNNGLANTGGGAFLTIQKAVNVVCSALDLGGYDVTIQVTGAVVENLVLKNYLGATATTNAAWSTLTGPKILGDRTTLISWTPASDDADLIGNAGCNLPWIIDGFVFSGPTINGWAAISANSSPIYIGKVELGDFNQAGYHLAGVVRTTEDYTISGGAYAHRIVNGLSSGAQDHPNYTAATVTITGTPTFDNFVDVAGGYLEATSVTYTGSITGIEYTVSANGVIQTYGAGADYFPGGAGSASTGGIYV
jgi:hypothetical protein